MRTLGLLMAAAVMFCATAGSVHAQSKQLRDLSEMAGMNETTCRAGGCGNVGSALAVTATCLQRSHADGLEVARCALLCPCRRTSL